MKFKKWYICLSILLFKNLRNMQDEGIWCTFEKERKQAIVCIFSLSIFILTRFLVNCRRPCEDKCSRVRTNGNSLTNILITNRLDNLTSCGENIRLKYRVIFVTVAERRLKSLDWKLSRTVVERVPTTTLAEPVQACLEYVNLILLSNPLPPSSLLRRCSRYAR